MLKIIIPIFAFIYLVNTRTYPDDLRHFKILTKSQRKNFGESCLFDCEYYRNWIPLVVMLNDTITSECPANLLDFNAVMGSKVMYKHWCPLIVSFKKDTLHSLINVTLE